MRLEGQVAGYAHNVSQYFILSTSSRFPILYRRLTDAVKSLQNRRVLSLDLSAIMAGSGIRGQFEEKFKALIKDIEDEVGYLDLLRLQL
jgi:hypothetical protein